MLKAHEFYVLFNREPDDTASSRVRKQYPEIRKGGWVTIQVAEDQAEGEDPWTFFGRMEAEARRVATEYFGTAWSSVHTQLSFPDFPEDEVIRIERSVIPAVEDAYSIVKRQRPVQGEGHVYWEDVRGLELLAFQRDAEFDLGRIRISTAFGVEEILEGLDRMATGLGVQRLRAETAGSDDAARVYADWVRVVESAMGLIREEIVDHECD